MDSFHFLYPSFITLIETVSLILLLFVFLALEVGNYVCCSGVKFMWEMATVSSRTESASSEHPLCSTSCNTSGVVNNVPCACLRCCMFLSIRISSIFLGYSLFPIGSFSI